ncbi:MAG: hypothetical protein FWE98_02820 [Oscillospiraceae bacterium]|nr:hypothetical protein [Oscillospiraceae bacterium]
MKSKHCRAAMGCLLALALLLAACGPSASTKSLAERYAAGELLYVDIGCPADLTLTPETRLALESAVKTRLGYPSNLLFRYAEIGGALPDDWAQKGPEILLGVRPGEEALNLNDPAQLALAADRIADELAVSLGIEAAEPGTEAPTEISTTSTTASPLTNPSATNPTNAPTAAPTKTEAKTNAPETSKSNNGNFSLTDAEIQKILRDMENGNLYNRTFSLYGDPVPMLFDFNTDGDPNTNGKMHITREKFDGEKMVLHVSRSRGNSNDFEYLTTITQKVDNPVKNDPHNQLSATILISVGREDKNGWKPCYEFSYIVSENQRFFFSTGESRTSTLNSLDSQPNTTVKNLSNYFV